MITTKKTLLSVLLAGAMLPGAGMSATAIAITINGESCGSVDSLTMTNGSMSLTLNDASCLDDAGGDNSGGGGDNSDAGSCSEAAEKNGDIVCKGTDGKFEGGGTYQLNRILDGEIHVWTVHYSGKRTKGSFSLTDGGLMHIGLSEVPGDLTPADKRCKTDPRTKGNGIRWADKAVAGRECPLVPGTTYYINISTDRKSDNYNLHH